MDRFAADVLHGHTLHLGNLRVREVVCVDQNYAWVRVGRYGSDLVHANVPLSSLKALPSGRMRRETRALLGA